MPDEMLLIESELRSDGPSKQMLLEKIYAAILDITRKVALTLDTPRGIHLDAGRIQVFAKRVPLVGELTDEQRTVGSMNSPYGFQLPPAAFKSHGMLPSLNELQDGGVTAVAIVLIGTLWDPFSIDGEPGLAHSPTMTISLVALDGTMRGQEIRLLALAPPAQLRLPIIDPLIGNAELSAPPNATELALVPPPSCVAREFVGMNEEWVEKPSSREEDSSDIYGVLCTLRHTGPVVLHTGLAPSPSPEIVFTALGAESAKALSSGRATMSMLEVGSEVINEDEKRREAS